MSSEHTQITEVFNRYRNDLLPKNRVSIAEPIINQPIIGKVRDIILDTIRNSPSDRPFPLSKIQSILSVLNQSPLFTPTQVRERVTENMIATPHEEYYLNLNARSLEEVVLLFYMLELGKTENESYPLADPTRWYTMNIHGRFTRLFIDSLHGSEAFPLPFRDDPHYDPDNNDLSNEHTSA